jgi:hypothetical protein
LLEKEPISKLCDEVGLQPTVNRWQKEFFENGLLPSSRRHDRTIPPSRNGSPTHQSASCWRDPHASTRNGARRGGQGRRHGAREYR